MHDFQVSHRTNHLLVEYDSPKAAKYAMTKLNGFEYPVGEPLMLKPDYDEYKYAKLLRIWN